MRSRILRFGLFAASVGLCLGLSTRAQATTQQIDTPFSTSILNPCNGELVDVTGVAHSVLDFTFTPSGNAIFGMHSNSHDVKGTGETTGTSYSGSSTIESETFESTTFPVVMTSVSDLALISHGSAPNFTLHILLVTVIDAQGNATASVNNFNPSCP